MAGFAAVVSATETGVSQMVVRADIPAGRVALVSTFVADPVPNPERDGRGDGGAGPALRGMLECPWPDCSNTYRSTDGVVGHYEDEHDDWPADGATFPTADDVDDRED